MFSTTPALTFSCFTCWISLATVRAEASLSVLVPCGDGTARRSACRGRRRRSGRSRLRSALGALSNCCTARYPAHAGSAGSRRALAVVEAAFGVGNDQGTGHVLGRRVHDCGVGPDVGIDVTVVVAMVMALVVVVVASTLMVGMPLLAARL